MIINNKFYYSDKCDSCHTFMLVLERHPNINNKLQKICIEAMTLEEIHDTNIRVVPAIVTNNQSFEGQNAFKWLQKEIEN